MIKARKSSGKPTGDNFEQYLHQISRPKLLTRSEEVDISQKIEGCYRNLVHVICDYNVREKAWGLSILLNNLKKAYGLEQQVVEEEPENAIVNEAYVAISKLEEVIAKSNTEEKRKAEVARTKDWLFELLYWSGYNPDPKEEKEEDSEISGNKHTIEMYRRIILSTVERINEELTEHYKRIQITRSNAQGQLYQKKKARTEKMIDKIKENIDAISGYRNELIKRNLRLVVNRAKRSQGKGLSFEDLVSAGNTGLIRAVEKFDYRRGYKFSTYAVWQIRAEIGKAISKDGKTIRLPENVLEDHKKWFETEIELFKELQRYPTDEEIAYRAVEKLSDERQKSETPESFMQKIKSSESVAAPTIPLDEPIKNNTLTTLKDMLEDKESPNPEECGLYLIWAAEVSSVLSTLTPREEKVIRMKYGIGGIPSHTLQEIGDHFSLTRSRIQQIRAKALEKLRHPSRKEILEALWE